MAKKYSAIITLLDNKEWFRERIENLDVTIHRQYNTTGRSEMGDFEAIAFVVSGSDVGLVLEELNNTEEFGF